MPVPPKKRSRKAASHHTVVRECPVCRYAYTPEGIAIIKREASMRILHLTCRRCQSALLACIRAVQTGMALVGVVTDVTAGEAERLLFGRRIEEDHILSLHHFLAKKGAIETYLLPKH